ncbi:MAG: glycosyltransferase family 2 protein [candidate division Zixibacteria bacterium]|nr:glycosyltransferase family 2 protein [candidate division Zixibacteria bacterium]
MPKISAIVITYNEEKNIGRCLSSIAWVDEIVVVDSESTDDTKKIASEFTPRVFDIKWEGFGKAKDFAKDKASHPWILSVDADEVVTEDLKEEIQNITKSEDSLDGYYISRKSNFLGKWIKHAWSPDYVLRLFKKDMGKFDDSIVHEKVEVEGEKGYLKNVLLHYTDPDFDHYLEKLNRYTSLGAKQLFGKGKRAKLFDVIFRPLAVFFKMYLVKRGFLDGLPGFILAVSSAFHVFSKYVKLWHLTSVNSGQ